MPRLIIGLAGTKGSGKSTAALALYRLGWSVLPFAGPLKKMAAILVTDDRYIYGDRKEEPLDWLDGITPRWIMQSLGTEWGRQLIHDELWIRVWRRQIEVDKWWEMPSQGTWGIVADDVRFQNEVDAIHSLEGHVILIERPERETYSDQALHASEKLDITPDATITNKGTIKDLEAQIIALAKGLTHDHPPAA